MTDYRLVPHPDFPSVAVTAIRVTVTPARGGLSVRYSIGGVLDRVSWPATATSSRTDNLWKYTCLEAFIADAQEGYTEYNFSPSGEWASYAFDRYRHGMRSATSLTEPAIRSGNAEREFFLDAVIGLDLNDTGRRLGLSAVIEAVDGTKSFWALAHAPGPPDFHNAATWTARLPASA